ncbi:MAG TPA: response regulator [Planctomycetaceae bacterium]|jgi:CheY-like chemotaxis protein
MPRPLKVIVVDDQVDFADTTGMLLRQLGYDAQVFYSATELLRSLDGKKPQADLVLCDIGMPGMDGCELARQLRQRPGFKKTVLAAVTGFGEEQHMQEAIAAGFDYRFVKPFHPGEIEDFLKHVSHVHKCQVPGRAQDACG